VSKPPQPTLKTRANARTKRKVTRGSRASPAPGVKKKKKKERKGKQRKGRIARTRLGHSVQARNSEKKGESRQAHTDCVTVQYWEKTYLLRSLALISISTSIPSYSRRFCNRRGLGSPSTATNTNNNKKGKERRPVCVQCNEKGLHTEHEHKADRGEKEGRQKVQQVHHTKKNKKNGGLHRPQL
jgi:hypothetical protein